MSDDLLKVALVIPVHNRREITLQCLKSLARIDRTGLDVRTFIIDDGSTDGTSDAIRSEYPEVELLRGDGTLHYAAGTNRGITAAMKWGADHIVAMNDDAVFHDQFLQRMIACSHANPRSVVGGLLLLWNEPHMVFQVRQVWSTLRGGWVIPQDITAFSVPEQAFEVEGIVGNCVLIPADAVRECGLLDERRFPHGWGDTQYTVRLRKAGWRLLIEPKAYIWCEPNTYPAPLNQLTFRRKLKVLFADEKHPLNLKRQFMVRWESAPSRTQAVLGFAVYLAILGGKTARVMLGLKPAEKQK